MTQMRQLSQLLACCHVSKWDSKISNSPCVADGNTFAVLIVNRGYLEGDLYSFFLLVSLAHRVEKQLPLIPLNMKLLDEGWIDHGNGKARVDQTVSSHLSSIILSVILGGIICRRISEDSATVAVAHVLEGVPWTLGKGVVMAVMSVISVIFVFLFDDQHFLR